MQSLGIFLVGFSIFCELLLLIMSFYFKENKIFFIALALLFFRVFYLFAPLLQAHFFTSLFLPFVFMLFTLMPSEKIVFDKRNLSKIALLFVFLILGLILSKSTNFNASLSESGTKWLFLSPINDISFYFFVFEALLLLVLSWLKNKLFIFIAFVLAFVQFLFQKALSFSYFELASVFLIVFLNYEYFKQFFYDKQTNLPNHRALKRFLKGQKKEFVVLKIKAQNFIDEKTAANETAAQKIMSEKSLAQISAAQIARALLKLQLNARLFYVNDDFIFVCDEAKSIKEALQKSLENSKFDFEIQSVKSLEI